MSSPILCAKIFFACGWLFLFAGLLTRASRLPSVDIYVHSTYIVIGQYHLLFLSTLALWIYAVFYYLGAVLFGLQLDPPLTILHLVVTMAGLIGLNSAAHLLAARATGSLTSHTFVRIGSISIVLILVGILMFVVTYLLSSGEKIWRLPKYFQK